MEIERGNPLPADGAGDATSMLIWRLVVGMGVARFLFLLLSVTRDIVSVMLSGHTREERAKTTALFENTTAEKSLLRRRRKKA